MGANTVATAAKMGVKMNSARLRLYMDVLQPRQFIRSVRNGNTQIKGRQRTVTESEIPCVGTQVANTFRQWSRFTILPALPGECNSIPKNTRGLPFKETLAVYR